MTTGFKIRQANSEDLNQLIPLLSQLTIVGSIESSQITDHIYNNIHVLYNTHTNDIVGVKRNYGELHILWFANILNFKDILRISIPGQKI